MSSNNLAGPLFAVALVIGLTGAGAVYFLSNGETDRPSPTIELGPFTQRMSSLTGTLASEMGSSTADEVSKDIEANLTTWVSNSEMLVPDHRVVLVSQDVFVTETQLAMELPLPSSGYEKNDGTLTPDSRMFGSSGALSAVPALRTNVILTISLEPENGGEIRYETISYSTETLDPERALSVLIDLLEDDTNSWYSRMARDVEYILNTIVRLRAANGVGTDFSDSYLHLMNGGDVELATNFALAVAMARWTGTVPPSLASSIDSHFSLLEPATIMNPSGNRYWGMSEIDNFRDYGRSAGNDPVRRSAEDLLSLVTTFGHADTADLFMRYLYLDRTGKTLGRTEALDLQSPLKENQLLDPRLPAKTFDPYSLEHHPSFTSYKGIPIITTGSLLSGNVTAGTLKPTLDTDFLVLGKDLIVKGIHDYNAWYTNANLSLTDENLIATGNGSQINKVTRCGAIPPPPQPPNHDYRIQWDLDIKGSFLLSADSVGWAGNTYDPSSMERTLEFSFPVRIYSGTGTLVDEGFKEHLRNINSGKQFYTPTSTGWLITSLANATEYFESRSWLELREAFGTLSSLSRSAGWADEMLGPLEARQSIHSSSMAALSSLDSWLRTTDAQEDLHIFYNNKIKVPGIDLNDLGPLRIDGQNLQFSYSLARDRMEIVSMLPQGKCTLEIGPISGGEMNVQGEVALWSGTRIELDLDMGTFTVHGNFAGYNINEGSSMPKQPGEIVTRLLSSAYLASPTLSIDIMRRPSPYLSGDYPESDDDLSISASVLLIGEDLGDVIRSLPDVYGKDLGTVFRSIVPYAEENGLSIGIHISFQGGKMPDLSRMIVFPSLSTDDLVKLDKVDILDQIILDLTTGSRMKVPDTIGEELIMWETTPSWTIHVPGGMTSGDVLTTIHVSPLGQASFSYFTANEEVPLGETWSMVPGSSPSPLW